MPLNRRKLKIVKVLSPLLPKKIELRIESGSAFIFGALINNGYSCTRYACVYEEDIASTRVTLVLVVLRGVACLKIIVTNASDVWIVKRHDCIIDVQLS